MTERDIDEILYKYGPELTDVEHIKLRAAINTYVNEAEGKARKETVLNFRKVAKYEKDRGRGCERILGEAKIMGRNGWKPDERYGI